ncbi:MAG: DUF2961 domain-containing protein [Chitinivibrionales bacterium]|nr:DUF2961 domain-containing protein [Chitinivibrionales bacterium]
MRTRMYVTPALLALMAMSTMADVLSYADILGRLNDLHHLATLPPPGIKTAQFSSYDRSSRYDATTDSYVNWGANADKAEMVSAGTMAQIQGPGVIWRVWNAEAGEGPVAVYVDGAVTPVVNLPFSKWFDRATAPFNYPFLVFRAGLGNNNYVPIPFSQSCRIAAGEGWGEYYHVTYTTFPADWQLPSFSPTRTAGELAVLQGIGAKFTHSKLGDYPYAPVPGEQTYQRTVAVGSGVGAVSTVLHLRGEGAITMIRVTPPLSGDTDADRITLRELSIRIYWDGEQQPSVWAPLCDFFGSAPGYNGYRSLPLSMRDNAMSAFWYMPYASEAKIQLLNDGHRAHEIEFTITTTPLALPIGEYGRFHAKWHRDAFLPTHPDRDCDWTLLKVNGRGRYVGVHLHVWNPNGDGYYNARYPGGTYWWGEGDEKFFIDGEKFPSTFGTGTEDYFGYAWALPWVFSRPYVVQSINEDNAGHISNARWHISDSYPFQQSFEGAIEKFYGNDFPTIYAATAYWYSEPSADDPYPQVGVADRVRYWRPSYTVASATAWEDPYAGEIVAVDIPQRARETGPREAIQPVRIRQGNGQLSVDGLSLDADAIRLVDLRGRSVGVLQRSGTDRFAGRVTCGAGLYALRHRSTAGHRPGLLLGGVGVGPR